MTYVWYPARKAARGGADRVGGAGACARSTGSMPVAARETGLFWRASMDIISVCLAVRAGVRLPTNEKRVKSIGLRAGSVGSAVSPYLWYHTLRWCRQRLKDATTASAGARTAAMLPKMFFSWTSLTD